MYSTGLCCLLHIVRSIRVRAGLSTILTIVYYIEISPPAPRPNLKLTYTTYLDASGECFVLFTTSMVSVTIFRTCSLRSQFLM